MWSSGGRETSAKLPESGYPWRTTRTITIEDGVPGTRGDCGARAVWVCAFAQHVEARVLLLCVRPIERVLVCAGRLQEAYTDFNISLQDTMADRRPGI